jgi:hypothetical protein
MLHKIETNFELTACWPLTEGVGQQVNLSSTSARNSITSSQIGVTGTLGVSNGGTGVTANPSMLVKLDSTSADNVFKTDPKPGVSGILPINRGGTGANSESAARASLGAAASGQKTTGTPSTPHATVLAYSINGYTLNLTTVSVASSSHSHTVTI